MGQTAIRAGAEQRSRGEQMLLWDGEACAENPDFLSRQLITYIGNKRALLGPILRAVATVRAQLGGRRLRVFDAFSGSGVVSRALKAHADLIVSNDIEDYAAVIGRCYLANRNDVDMGALGRVVRALNEQVANEPPRPGFIAELYAPQGERPARGERVFYTRANALRLDSYRQLIEGVPPAYRGFVLGPLLSSASVHANTAGVFKGFYKGHDGIGRFGGRGDDALSRIMGEISAEVPVLSTFTCAVQVTQDEAIRVAAGLREIDLAYLDPPYNQHPYGSNYFMLNLLVHYQRPARVSRVSGIPEGWRRSGYNVRSRSLPLFSALVRRIPARFLLISFNNEGFIGPHQMRDFLARCGRVTSVEVPYTAFRGSRSFANRPVNVTEQLFLVDRG